MHRALYIPDLIFEILSWLESDRSKLDFGFTCRTIWLLAFPEVWKSVDFNAICCLLIDADFFRMLRMTKYEWQPMRDYGHHIRQLHISEFPATKLSIERVSLVIDNYPYHQAEPLFPQLKSVSLDLDRVKSLVRCSFFIKRPLENHSYKRSEALLPGLMTAIIHSLPSSQDMRELNLRFRPYEEPSNRDRAELEATIGDLLDRLPCLVSLTLSHGNTLFPRAATLPSLEKLNIRSLSNRPYFLGSNAFPKLKVLQLGFSSHSAPFSAMKHVEVFDRISSPSLTEFEFACGQIQVPVLHAMLQTIARKWSSTMRKLVLKAPVGQQLNLPFNYLSPLLDCGALQFVTVDGPRNMIICDEDYDAISSAWPHLRGLWFPPDPNKLPSSLSWVPLATRQSLLLLSTRCRDLLHLRISVDFGKEGTPADIGDGPVASESLTDLNLAHSSRLWNQAGTVAEFLRATFPNMKTFSSYTKWDDGVMAEVAEHLGVKERSTRPKPDMMKVLVDSSFAQGHSSYSDPSL